MYVDDIQLQGQVGYLIQQGMTQVHYFLNTHLHFDIAYNDDGLDTKGESRVRAVHVCVHCSRYPTMATDPVYVFAY